LRGQVDAPPLMVFRRGQPAPDDVPPYVEERPAPNRAILVTLFGSALRVSELCALQFGDLDLGRRHAWITAKGKREKVLIELPDATVSALRAYLRYRGTGPGQLFQSLPGRSKSREGFGTRSVRKLIRAMGATVGLTCWPHAIRHSAITAALETGAQHGLSIHDVAQFSRHASIATVQHYLDNHRAGAAKRQLTDLVGGRLTAAEGESPAPRR
jgi:integrase/recombinase XerC